MIDRTVALLVVAGFLAGCSPAGASGDRGRLEGLAVASVALAEAMADDDAEPRPEPDDGECDLCGGKGWYRPDGSIKVDCPDCDADTLSDAVMLAPDRLRVYSRENCPPCRAWEEQVLPRLEEQGWVVGQDIEIVNTADPFWATPSFVWLDGGQIKERKQGYSSRDRFLRWLKSAMGQ